MMPRPMPIFRLLLASLVTVVITGCGDATSDLVEFTRQVKAKPPGRIEPIPEFLPYQNFEYTSQDLRDPFRLVDFSRGEENAEEINSIASGPKPILDRPREPLEEFPLDTLRLKGTLTKDGIIWGLIFAPDNTVHRVLEGHYLGQNHGRITLVTDEKIELTEIVPDGLGNYIERSSAVALIE